MPEMPDVVILVGGEGKRLQSVVSDRPKPMALVLGKPFLEGLILLLKKQGLRRFILATGFKGEMVQAYFAQHSIADIEIIYCQEPHPLGTAGAIRYAMDWVKTETCLILNGDSYFPIPLDSFLKFHHQQKSAASLLLTQLQNADRYGVVQMNSKNEIMAFNEKLPQLGEGLISTGIYLLNRSFVSQIPKNQKLSIEKDIFPQWVGKGLYGMVAEGTFIDIGTPESYAKAGEILKPFYKNQDEKQN